MVGYHEFELYGMTVFTNVQNLSSPDKLTDAQKEAVHLARHELMKKRHLPKIAFISAGQVVVLPELCYDLLGNIAVVDVGGVRFDQRVNRTDGR